LVNFRQLILAIMINEHLPKSPEPEDMAVNSFLEITENSRADRPKTTQQIDALINEARSYLEKWQNELQLPALIQPDLEIGQSDPVWAWTSQAIDDFFQQYLAHILPPREQKALKQIWAHGTYCSNLFKQQKTPSWDGIINTGKMRGQFGMFEQHNTGDFARGAWFGDRGKGTAQRMSSECWLLIDDADADQQRTYEESHQLRSLSLVFVDPRTYCWYLEELRRKIEGGENIIPHTAMRLDQLKEYLESHQGKFPFEIQEGS
jgi:hypothetical protein